MKFLVRFAGNWSDEIDCQQFVICEKEFDVASLIVGAVQDGGAIGSNQYFEPGEITSDNFKVKQISDRDAEILCQTLGLKYGWPAYGVGPL